MYIMPYGIRKTRNKNCYNVFNKKTKHKFSKCSTFENAKKQLRLLRALQFNKNFVSYTRSKEKKINNISRKK